MMSRLRLWEVVWVDWSGAMLRDQDGATMFVSAPRPYCTIVGR